MTDTYLFSPMNSEYAAEIVTRWQYPDEYALYDYLQEADHIYDSDNWGKGLYAVVDGSSALVGDLSFGFLDQSDEWIDLVNWTADGLENAILWVGFGMRPDLTGRGYGLPFVRACCDYALQRARHFGYLGSWIGLGVAWFNQRAVKTYQRAGFEIYYRGEGEINGSLHQVVRMRKFADK